MDILKFFIDNYFSFTSMVDIVKFLLPILTTYFLTKYSVSNPKKREINQHQFTNVYLPLYKLFCCTNKKKFTYEEAKRCSVRLHNILQKNYELAFPQLHSLSENLTSAINNKKGYEALIIEISYQISLDYEILKKKLGYPHLNQWELFKRLTFIDKIKAITGYITIIYIFTGPFIISPTGGTLRSLLYYLFGLAVISYIGYNIGKLKY